MAAEEEARPLLAHGTPTADARDHPEVRASLLAKATFSWLGPLLEQGATAPLQLGDLWHVREHDDATHVANKLLGAMRTRVAAGDANPFALWRAIHQVRPARTPLRAWEGHLPAVEQRLRRGRILTRSGSSGCLL
jgi:hypothetical protein